MKQSRFNLIFFCNLDQYRDEVILQNIFSRHIHRKRQWCFPFVFPFSKKAAGFFPDILIHFINKAILFENWNKLCRRNIFSIPVPSCQRLCPYHSPVYMIVLGLKPHFKLSFLESFIHAWKDLLFIQHFSSHKVAVLFDPLFIVSTDCICSNLGTIIDGNNGVFSFVDQISADTNTDFLFGTGWF